jgi:hypothetical protein
MRNRRLKNWKVGLTLWLISFKFFVHESAEYNEIFISGSLLVNGGMQNSGSNGFNALQESATLPPLGPPAVPQNRFEPYFDAMTPRNVTALVGKSAYLSCRVRNLGNKTVSFSFY